jgi:cell division protein FtsB
LAGRATRIAWRRWWRRVWPALLLLAVLAYFGVQAVRGDRGLLAWLRLEDETTELRQRLDEVRDEREALERQVDQLRSESVDPDRLDEEARRNLGYAHPDERIILEGDPEQPTRESGSR